jgi:hypothetical protein
MSLIYALYGESLATCPLNFDVDYKKEMELKNILNIRDEAIIMYISLGNYKKEMNIAISTKPEVEDITKII